MCLGKRKGCDNWAKRSCQKRCALNYATVFCRSRTSFPYWHLIDSQFTHTHTESVTHQAIQSLYNQIHKREGRKKRNIIICWAAATDHLSQLWRNLFAHNLFNKKPFDSVKQQQQQVLVPMEAALWCCCSINQKPLVAFLLLLLLLAAFACLKQACKLSKYLWHLPPWHAPLLWAPICEKVWLL